MPVLYEPHLVYDQTNAAYWDDEVFIDGTSKVAVEASLCRVSLMSARFRRTQAVGVSEDLAICTVAWGAQAVGTAPISTLSANDALSVETKFLSDFYGPFKTAIADDWILQDFVWRNTGADGPRDKNGHVKPGPVWRTTPAETPGTSTAARLADQISSTITFRTASRRHWGRIYLGGLTTLWHTDSRLGRWGASNVDLLCGGWDTLLRNLADEALIINQWIWSAKHRGALSVNSINVDDVPDVVRRRRAKVPTYRKQFGLP